MVCRQVHLPRNNKKKKKRKSPSSHHPHPHCVCCGDFSCCHASHGPSWQRKDRINEYYWDKTSCTGQSGDVDPFSIHTFYTFKCLFYYRCIWVCIFQWEYTSEISKVFTSVAQQTLFLQSKGFIEGFVHIIHKTFFSKSMVAFFSGSAKYFQIYELIKKKSPKLLMYYIYQNE